MREVGIDISGQAVKKVDPLLRERVAYLVTLCDRATELLSHFSGGDVAADLAYRENA
jgi:protein-tyrosine-phosphatase